MAQLHFTAQASTKDMGKSDYVQVQFVIENAKEIGNVQTPDLSDFTIIEGPNQSTGMSITNGNMSQYKGIIFLLQPKKTGTLTIKPATATVDGQLMHSNALQITVHNQGGQGNSKSPGFNPLPDPAWPTGEPSVDMDELVRPGENVEDKIRKNFFVKVEVSKTDCYLGEPIVATYKLYARLRSDSRVTRHPSLNGFSVYDMVDPSEDRVSVEKINGKNFSVHVIRKTQLIPLQPGDVTLDPMELDNNIYFIRADAGTDKKSSQGMGGLLDRLFEPEISGTPFTQHIVLNSKPVTIHVKPLPETGKPTDFNGAVGKYSIQASLDTKEVDTGDAANLSVIVKGSGNLPVINAPAVNWPPDMESYDVNSKENIDKTIAPLSGSKTYTYSFIAAKVGKYTLPPIKLSYFDPSSRMYKTVETDPLSIQVNHSKKKKHINIATVPANEINTDWTKYVWGSAAFLLVSGTIIYIRRLIKKNTFLKEDKAKLAAALEKAKMAPAVIDPLKASRDLMDSGDFTNFYTSINRSIWKAVSDKLQLHPSELNKLNIASGLRNQGWSDEEIIQLNSVLNECEIKLYTPEFSTSDMQRILNSADEIMSKLGRR
ncbi:MAG TPA: BatD family protein [Puia sp.]|nr:BatD family protein [Puia sp.]